MNAIKLVFLSALLSLNLTCGQNSDLDHVTFLIGTWKMEGKENYESWDKIDNALNGQSYKIENGQKYVSEKIEIRVVNNNTVYTPTVFDQNEGKGIPFELKMLDAITYSFENSEHDFPKKIQYRILDKDTLFISVLGENDKGFSYKLIRKQVD